jgi:phosphoglycolate phosphatase-like HAD superfamily hydrolase
MRVRGVVLDVDGTLVDSNDAHARAWHTAFSEAGFDVAFARVRSLIGMGGDKLLREVTGLDDEGPAARRILERRQQVFLERELPGLRAFPGARSLLKRMRWDGLERAVASAAQPQERDKILVQAGLADLLPHPGPARTPEGSKPDPDIVEAALQELGLGPEEAMMIGDTPYDVKAARGAGVPIIAFRSGGRRASELLGAEAIYEGPWDLLARYDSSPLCRSRVCEPDDSLTADLVEG